MKNIKSLAQKFIPVFFFLSIIFSQNVFGQVNITPTRTDVAGFPTWTDTDITGTTYLQLLKSTSITISPAMNFDGYTNETLDFTARTYGGTSATENTITVSVSINNGSTWAIVGTAVPTSTTMKPFSFDLSSYSGTQVKVKFTVAGSSTTIGPGIDDIDIKGIVAACNVPTVQASNITFNNTGLDNMTINWTKGNGANSVVYVNTINSFTNPVDGVEGTASTVYTSGQKIVYGGTGSSVTITGLTPNTQYFVQVYTYNCSGTQSKYFVTSPINNNNTTTNYCSGATTQSSAIVATPSATSIDLSWTKGNGDYRIVIAKKLTAVTAVPAFGETYNASSSFGSGFQIEPSEYVVYKGTGNSVTVTGLLELTKYYFAIYEFCAPTGVGSETYLTSPAAPTKFTTTLTSAPTTCFEIESILVDACALSEAGWNPEGANEMVRFKIGNIALDADNLDVSWPTVANTWQGVIQNASTAAITASLNSTILSSCGILIEPINGVLPAGSNVLLISSSVTQNSSGKLMFDLNGNSFSTLTDTLYVIYQNNTTNTAGNFTNYNSDITEKRTLTMSFSPPGGCSDQVTYYLSKLVNKNGTVGGTGPELDGGRVDYDWDNTPHYVNNGCQAPFEPTSIRVTLDGDANKTDFCANSPIVLKGVIEGNVAVVTSSVWSTTAPNMGTFVVINDTITHYFPSATESGARTFTFTAQTTGCTDGTLSDNVSVNIWQIPTVAPTANPSTVGGGGNSTLTANAASGSGTYSYSWTPTLSISGSSTAATATTTALAQTTDFTVAVTDTKSGCPAVDSVVTVIVNNGELTMPANVSICAGESYKIEPSVFFGVAPYSFKWTSVPVDASLDAIQDILEKPTVSPTVTTQYLLTSTDANLKVDTGYITIYVKQLPVIDLKGPHATCGSAITLRPSTTTIYDSYLWSPGNTTDSTLVVSSTGLATVNYSVTVTKNGCQSIDNADVTINANPTVDLGGDITECEGTAIPDLDAGSSGTYVWSTAATTQTIPVTQSGTYRVTVTFPGNCTDDDEVIVTINENPNIVIAESGYLCDGLSIKLTASADNCASCDYSWSPGGQTSNQITIYTGGDFAVDATNPVTTCTANAQLSVVQHPNPVVDLGGPESICLDAAPFPLDAGNAGSSFLWSDGTTGPTNMVNTLGDNNVSVTVTTVPYGCQATDDKVVTINPMPVELSVLDRTEPYVPGEDTQVTLDAQNVGCDFAWYDGHNGSPYTVDVPTEEVDTTFYPVIITTPNGCTSTQVFYVVLQKLNVEVFNVITPNNDTKNDVWEIKYIDFYPKAVVTILNRNGDVVFKSTGSYPGPGHDDVRKFAGKRGNSDLPAGVYFYVIDMSAYSEYKDNGELKGYITVIKEKL